MAKPKEQKSEKNIKKDPKLSLKEKRKKKQKKS